MRCGYGTWAILEASCVRRELMIDRCCHGIGICDGKDHGWRSEKAKVSSRNIAEGRSGVVLACHRRQFPQTVLLGARNGKSD